MSSSQPFQPSSPLYGSEAGRRRKSRFTYRNLAHLATFTTTCPLRVVAHVDLDAFYAQCEQVRLGVAADQPLAVQQWEGLIAINYPSRKFGLTRMITPTEAKKLCPHIILQHVATWKEGDEKWQYHNGAAKNIATHKVSLDPYRMESRKILACIKESLPANLQKVEKAGTDEFYLDLSAHVHAILLERYPELAGPAPYDDPTECLPLPPSTVLDWQADAVVDLGSEEAEDMDPDWDDFAILIGSEIVRNIRAVIWEKLKYTVSGGIAQNKILAKLGSAHQKPNQQTVIRNRAVQQFLFDFKFTKIRGLGGKLGDQVASIYGSELVKDLLPVPLEQLKQKLGDDTGTWVYQVIRGMEASEVNARTHIKSMLSAKSFRPSINTIEQANRWLRIFVADIFSRLVEEGVLENKRKPKILNLQHRHGGQVSSRSTQLPQGRKLDETVLFDLAKGVMRQIVAEGNVWPCSNISMSVSGFEEGIVGNMGISSFLVKGDEAKALNTSREPSAISATERPDKRRRVELQAPIGIHKFLAKTETTEEHDDEFGAQITGVDRLTAEDQEAEVRTHTDAVADSSPHNVETIGMHGNNERPSHQARITDYICKRCNISVDTADDLRSHEDWHFAKDLQDEDRAPTKPLAIVGDKKHTLTSTKKKPARGKVEKGQTKLAFG
ncbi:hypothetical protein B0O99DRAFT_514461 [Bisporella sp. PMI_857]|nr:hypothetical protein B0O99DRAFT_514461 [Bisporella sp. PMI_857]